VSKLSPSGVRIVRDQLYYLSADYSTCPLERRRGVITGLVSGLMAGGMSFQQAIEVVAAHMPIDYVRESIPEAWRTDLDAAFSVSFRLLQLGYGDANIVDVFGQYLIEIQQNGFNYHLSERHVNQLLDYPGPHPIQLVDYYGVYYWYKEEEDSE